MLPSLASQPLAAFPVWKAVGFCITGFGACSAFTRVTARMVAEPPEAVLCRRSASADYAELSIVQSIFRLAARRRPAGIGKAFTAPVTERWIGRKRRPAVGLLWALHCGQTARVGICRAATGRLATAGGQRRWPRRWSWSPPRGSQTQVDRPGDSGSSGGAPGGRRCASHDESTMAGYAQAPAGWSVGCMLPSWQRGHWRNERPVSAS